MLLEVADPLNEQLADALARAIEIGILPAGTKLPAERELARELALSRTTIVAAYDRLRLAGLARSRQGSGTRVATRRPGLFAFTPTRPEDTDTEAPFRIARSPAGAGGSPDWLVQHDADAIQFTIGALPAGPAVAGCVETAVRDDVPALLNEMGYDPFGWPRLRAGIAAYLMMGILWTFAYTLVARVDPGSFLFSSGSAPHRPMAEFEALFVSFGTLTNVPYGEVSPVSKAARMLMMAEAMTGIFFVAVFLARLVSLYSSSSPESPQAG